MLAIQVECKQIGECVILDWKVGEDTFSFRFMCNQTSFLHLLYCQPPAKKVLGKRDHS